MVQECFASSAYLQDHGHSIQSVHSSLCSEQVLNYLWRSTSSGWISTCAAHLTLVDGHPRVILNDCQSGTDGGLLIASVGACLTHPCDGDTSLGCLASRCGGLALELVDELL